MEVKIKKKTSNQDILWNGNLQQYLEWLCNKTSKYIRWPWIFEHENGKDRRKNDFYENGKMKNKQYLKVWFKLNSQILTNINKQVVKRIDALGREVNHTVTNSLPHLWWWFSREEVYCWVSYLFPLRTFH